MNQLYKTPSIPHTTEVEPSTLSTQSPIDPIPSSSNPVTSLHPPSPFSFSPCLHCILGRSRYVPTEDEDPKDEGILEGCENYQSDSMVTPLATLNSQTVNNSVHSDNGMMGDNDPEGCRDDENRNQTPSSLEYSDGEKGKANEMVISEEDDEEVDELDSSEYEGHSMVGMMVNMDSGGYYEKDVEDVVIADDNVPTDMGDGMPEADMDEDLPERKTENLGGEMVADEIPVEMEVDGDTCLFSRTVIAELHLLRENVRLRGEEIDEELGEFSEEQEYGDMISTVVVRSAPVAGPSQPQRGQTGGNSKYFLFFTLP
jgi:hypothetical protein